MLILTFQILCVDKIGSRAAAAACIISEITITTKISAPGRLQNVDFPLPALLVYETHNECRLGNNQIWSKQMCDLIIIIIITKRQKNVYISIHRA